MFACCLADLTHSHTCWCVHSRESRPLPDPTPARFFRAKRKNSDSLILKPSPAHCQRAKLIYGTTGTRSSSSPCWFPYFAYFSHGNGKRKAMGHGTLKARLTLASRRMLLELLFKFLLYKHKRHNNGLEMLVCSGSLSFPWSRDSVYATSSFNSTFIAPKQRLGPIITVHTQLWWLRLKAMRVNNLDVNLKKTYILAHCMQFKSAELIFQRKSRC